jgi:hypothetical protein
MATTVALAPDFARFAKGGLCPCTWKREQDYSCNALRHTIYRIPTNGQTPHRLAPFHFACTSGTVLHLWRLEHWIPQDARVEEADERVLTLFDNVQPRVGLEAEWDRDEIVLALPTHKTVRAKVVVAFRLRYAGEKAWEIVQGAEDPNDPRPPGRQDLAYHYPPAFEAHPSHVVTFLNGHLLWNALQGVGPTFRMWIPEEWLKPVTIEGDGTRAIVMPMRLD